MPILSLQDVSKDYLTDGQRVHALKDLSFGCGAWRICGVGRTQRLRKIHSAQSCRSHGLSDVGQSASGWCFDVFPERQRPDPIAARESWVRFSVVSIAANPDGFRERRTAATAGREIQPARVGTERLAWVELKGLGDRYPHQLSGGQMQRVAIARALVHSPSVLLADEPTGNLDTITGNVILELLRRLTWEQNTATVMATHSPEAASLANTLVRLRDGKIEEITRR